MPRSRLRVKRRKVASSKKEKSTSLFSLLKNLFSCTGKNSVRVQPQHVPAAAEGKAKSSQVSPPLSVFYGSRPATAANESRSRPSTCWQPIKESTKMAAISVPAESISGLDATSGHTISARPEFVGHASETPLEGLNPSPATSSTSAQDSSTLDQVEERRAPEYFRTTLTQLRQMQRQKRREERMKREQKFGRRRVSFVLVEEEKPKKRLSVQIREEETAIKEMQRMLVDLDQDETEVLKKMQELNNWRMKIQTVKNYHLYMTKAGQLNEVILILEDRLHKLKNYGEKIEAKMGYKKENLAKLKAEYEQMVASGVTEEDLEAEELLKQFYPTLGLPADTALSSELNDLEDDNTAPRSGYVPPRCKNPIAAQLLGEKSKSTKAFKCQQEETAPPMSEILKEYRQDMSQMKRREPFNKVENVGMRKFMQALMQSENNN